MPAWHIITCRSWRSTGARRHHRHRRIDLPGERGYEWAQRMELRSEMRLVWTKKVLGWLQKTDHKLPMQHRVK